MSKEFEQYLKSRGIAQKKSIPYWPGSNRKVGRFSRTLLKQFRTAAIENKNWRNTLDPILLKYHSTKHVTTNCTPSVLLFNRKSTQKYPLCRGGYYYYYN